VAPEKAQLTLPKTFSAMQYYVIYSEILINAETHGTALTVVKWARHFPFISTQTTSSGATFDRPEI
jgi:hypothetical protein